MCLIYKDLGVQLACTALAGSSAGDILKACGTMLVPMLHTGLHAVRGAAGLHAAERTPA